MQIPQTPLGPSDGSKHTTSNGTICFSLFSIALHTTNINRHSSIPHDMQPNESCHKCPILPLYRLTNLNTDSPNTFTSFTWIHAHNHALQFMFSLLTSGPSTSATLVPITQPVTALNAFHYFRLHCTRRMSIDTVQFHTKCNAMKAATNALYARYID
jgi:hypothetical protein